MSASAHRTDRLWADPDRLLAVALGVSLLGHLAFLCVQLVLTRFSPPPVDARPLKLIYDRQTPQSASNWVREDDAPSQARMKDHARAMTVTVPGSVGGGLTAGLERRRDVALGASAGMSGLGTEAGTAGYGGSDTWAGGAWASAADLTDIAQAAQGNPVLLSYFSSIREQIQRTANFQPWAPAGGAESGMVSVGFVIDRSGALRSASVVPERSTAGPQLRDIALRIVQAASPFLPFPPSFTEPSKAIIVPIEFSDRRP